MQTVDRIAGSSLSEQTMLVLVSAFAVLEGYDLACYGVAAGGVVAPLVAAALLPGASWRWIYVAAPAPALVLIPLAARLLPESPVHLRLSRGVGGLHFRRQGELFGLRPLLTARARAATGLFWAMSFCGLLLVFGISTWLPTIMRNSGYSLGSALLQTAVLWGGAGGGMVAGGRIADALGPNPLSQLP